MVKESVVQKKLMEKLREEFKGSYIRKIHSTIYSHNGVPDVLACINGLFIAIEVKTDTGRVSKLQERELNLVDQAGGLALICRGLQGIGEVTSAIRVHRATAVHPPVRDDSFLLSK